MTDVRSLHFSSLPSADEFFTFPPMEATTPTKDRSHWTVKKFTSFDEQRTWQVKEWQKLSGAERRKVAWELVYDYWVGMKGMNPDELRLQRVITGIKRPQR